MQDEDQASALKEIKKLRELDYSGRVSIIKSRVKDVAMQQLLNIMLRDQNERPSAEMLLQHPALVFFDYMVNRVDQNFSFDYAMNDQITKKIEIIPSLVSALSLSNKNKAIVAFFTLMRMLEQHQYEQRFQRHVIDLVLSN